MIAGGRKWEEESLCWRIGRHKIEKFEVRGGGWRGEEEG